MLLLLARFFLSFSNSVCVCVLYNFIICSFFPSISLSLFLSLFQSHTPPFDCDSFSFMCSHRNKTTLKQLLYSKSTHTFSCCFGIISLILLLVFLFSYSFSSSSNVDSKQITNETNIFFIESIQTQQTDFQISFVCLNKNSLFYHRHSMFSSKRNKTKQ